jgi:hypothetical protein
MAQRGSVRESPRPAWQATDCTRKKIQLPQIDSPVPMRHSITPLTYGHTSLPGPLAVGEPFVYRRDRTRRQEQSARAPCHVMKIPKDYCYSAHLFHGTLQPSPTDMPTWQSASSILNDQGTPESICSELLERDSNGSHCV